MQVFRIVHMWRIFATFSILFALLFAISVSGAGGEVQNGKIVFVGGDTQSGNFQLYTMNPDGTGMVRITSLPANNFESLLPNISPDGQRIVFCFGNFNTASPFADLWVINIDGTGLKQLTTDGLSCFPRWSPDGTLIIFAHLAININNTGIAVVTTMRAGRHRDIALPHQ